jgi:phage terminase large subunit-like protein
MDKQKLMAKNNNAEEREILTKTFNMWVNMKSDWLSLNLILKNTEPVNIENFKADDKIYGIMGIDLGATSDLTSISLAYNNNDKIYFKSWCFIPEVTLMESPNKHMYKHWVETGQLIVTPGNATDYDYVLNKILEINEHIKLFKVMYDKWNATQFTENATKHRINMIPYSQALGNFNAPTKEFERLLRLGKAVIDDNEVVRWCLLNATLKEDWNGNVKPVKSGTRNEKIDAAISMLQALGGMLETKTFKHFFVTI